MALLMAIAPLGNAPRAVAAPAGSPIPDDRYVMAGGCYAVRSLALGRYLSRAAGGVAATAATRTGAEPFHFQATALGSYLLYGTAQDFVAAKEGAAGDLARSLTETTAGGILGGLSGGATDAAADALAQRPAGSATGRGSSVVLAADASELADWEITRVARQSFRLRLPATGQTLVTTADGNVALGQSDAAGPPAQFRFEPVNGCARFPEAEVNVTGPVAHGATGFEEVRGYLEGHSHPMAFEFLGGMARCGRPWHAYGITRALVDCPDHEPGGRGAVLEQVVSGGTPGESHDTVGWPTFGYWPNPDSLTHEQVYYKWLERAWRGGLRLYVSLLVDNHVLCEVYPYRRNSCDEMDGVRLQAQRIRELQDYIDAQSGGPGKGWFRIVTDPFEARQIVNQGKLAVVLGIEVSSPLGCEVINDEPQCDEPEIDRQLDAVYDLGVRQMELTNKFDNALTGVTGDGGSTGVVVNGGNFLQTGRFWQFDTCEEDAGDSTDNRQYNLHDETGAPGTDRDGIFGAILRMAGTTGAAPVYGPGPHCNVRGLSDLGKHAIRHMASKGMIFDPDHMSARARQQALDLVESMHYSGIISSHGWADDDIYRRVIKAGGVVTPHAGNSTSFVQKWLKQRSWADPRYLFGIGYGADTNGFSHQGGPRGADVKNPVRYPFTGLGGVVIDRQVSGERIYDINVDGVAHYGLYPDWIEDLRMQAGDEIVRDLERGAEAYLQTWERGVGIAPNACRTDVPDLSDTQIRRLRRGMTPVQVLQALGQPDQRSGTTFGYCATGGRRATVEFTNGGRLVTVRFS
jgi:microsomal dipeptidase-like Zn-dependent dipeptidase